MYTNLYNYNSSPIYVDYSFSWTKKLIEDLEELGVDIYNTTMTIEEALENYNLTDENGTYWRWNNINDDDEIPF